VHWNRVGSARDEDGNEEAKREEKSNDEAKFPCAKRVMNCFAAYVQICQPATTVGDSFLVFEASIVVLKAALRLQSK